MMLIGVDSTAPWTFRLLVSDGLPCRSFGRDDPLGEPSAVVDACVVPRYRFWHFPQRLQRKLAHGFERVMEPVWSGTRNLKEGETVSWTGACAGGKATGSGTEVFRRSAGSTWSEERYVGEMRDGKLNGRGVLHFDGNSFEGPFIGGQRADGDGIYIYHAGAQYRGSLSWGKVRRTRRVLLCQWKSL